MAAVITRRPDGRRAATRPRRPRPRRPTLDDDAWIIFTSGSTGVPKGVAVTHRSAAAFVDAEADLFLAEPSRSGPATACWPGSRSPSTRRARRCGWRGGTAPASCRRPASLVRTGHGPRAVAGRAADHRRVDRARPSPALWPADALDQVRLLIFGGEACPPALVERRRRRRAARSGTPTARRRPPSSPAPPRSTADGPVRIGLPLAGWDLAVVDAGGEPVADGRDRRADHRRRRPGPLPRPEQGRRAVRRRCRRSGWARAYRSGDLVGARPRRASCSSGGPTSR